MTKPVKFHLHYFNRNQNHFDVLHTLKPTNLQYCFVPPKNLNAQFLFHKHFASRQIFLHSKIVDILTVPQHFSGIKPDAHSSHSYHSLLEKSRLDGEVLLSLANTVGYLSKNCISGKSHEKSSLHQSFDSI